MGPHVDYALARKATLDQVKRGERALTDVCDAHPELLRAARNVGEDADHPCPICEGAQVRYVSYVYGDGLRKANGTAVTGPAELERLGARSDEFARYQVEVCLDCYWNHLHQRELRGRRYA